MKIEALLSPKVLGVIILVLVLVVGVVSYKWYNSKSSLASAQNEAAQLVEAVGKIADLPAEAPTIATVTDKSKLSQYPFFSKAEIGDKVLLFNAAKKAYLYRPSTGKLIEVGPISVTNPEASSSGTPSQASAEAVLKKATVTILNGTKTPGLATKVQTDLLATLKAIEVTQKGNAKKDYAKTVVVMGNPAMKTQAEEIAKQLNVTVTTLPEGEIEPKTDIIIFLGTDIK